MGWTKRKTLYEQKDSHLFRVRMLNGKTFTINIKNRYLTFIPKMSVISVQMLNREVIDVEVNPTI